MDTGIGDGVSGPGDVPAVGAVLRVLGMGMPASRHGQKLMILTLLGWSADIPEGMSEWYETGETDSMALDLPASERLGLCKLAMMMATALLPLSILMLRSVLLLPFLMMTMTMSMVMPLTPLPLRDPPEVVMMVMVRLPR